MDGSGRLQPVCLQVCIKWMNALRNRINSLTVPLVRIAFHKNSFLSELGLHRIWFLQIWLGPDLELQIQPGLGPDIVERCMTKVSEKQLDTEMSKQLNSRHCVDHHSSVTNITLNQ